MDSPTPTVASLPGTATVVPITGALPSPPLLVGLKAARANLLPGLCLQALMLAIVFAYYRVEAMRPWFDRLGQWKASSGYLFTITAAIIAGALLPEMFKWCFLRRRLPAWRDAGELLFAACFYATNSLCVEYFYRWQTAWFGSNATFAVLAKKVAVDQLIYNPVFAAPFAVVCFAWRNGGYSFAAVKNLFSAQAYLRLVIPTLMATWLVWLPAVTVIYSLPPLLQIPIFSLALCFWALMLAYINNKPEPLP